MHLFRISRLAVLATIAAIALSPSPVHAESYLGLSLQEAIQVLDSQGLSVLYSTALVRPDMVVETEPSSTAATEILAEILRPHGLKLSPGPNGALLVVRAQSTADVDDGQPVNEPSIEELLVNASSYQFVRGVSSSVTTLSVADLEVLPDLGDDPLRAVARLPGTAANGFTAKSNVRGGEVDETLVRFDGLRLYNPFHLKDFQSLFSTINQGNIDGMDVYTGGFPARYGDRMSSVIDISPLTTSEGPHGELSLSFFNASALVGGTFDEGDGDWLVSARRGNLDLIFDVVKVELGEPKYVDAYARLGYQLTDALRVTGNFLLFEDDLLLTDSDQEEEATAEYQDKYLWLRLDHRVSAQLEGYTLLARTDVNSKRRGTYNLSGVGTGKVIRDVRSFTIDSIQTDWVWRSGESTEVRFGGNASSSTGHYDYQSQAQFDVVFLTPGASLDPNLQRSLSAQPDGDQYGIYATLQLMPLARLTTELGLRWDKETLTLNESDQLSPRIKMMYELGRHSQLRASWGRFVQAQNINELQIEDGVSEYFAPQRSDHFVVGFDHAFRSGIDLRFEIFRKKYTDLRPRYENLLNSLVLLPEIMPDRIRVAPNEATARGTEISLRQTGAGPFSWWLSYTWLSVKDDIAGSNIKCNWDQTNGIGAGVGWSNAKWDVTIAATYHTGWPTTAATLGTTNPLPVAITGPRNAENLSEYRTVDFKLARTFGFDRSSLVVFLEVTNTFNRKNVCCLKYEVSSETGTPLLELEPVDDLPILPSLGVTWRF